MVRTKGIDQDWSAYPEQALRELAAEFLEALGIGRGSGGVPALLDVLSTLDGEVLFGPWQNVLRVECDTGPRTRTVWYQIRGE